MNRRPLVPPGGTVINSDDPASIAAVMRQHPELISNSAKIASGKLNPLSPAMTPTHCTQILMSLSCCADPELMNEVKNEVWEVLQAETVDVLRRYVATDAWNTSGKLSEFVQTLVDGQCHPPLPLPLHAQVCVCFCVFSISADTRLI